MVQMQLHQCKNIYSKNISRGGYYPSNRRGEACELAIVGVNFRNPLKMKTIDKNQVNDKIKIEDKDKCYYVYILSCENNILYTGVTTDYKRRFLEHSKANGTKKGAKFTKVHKPKKIVALWSTSGRSLAQKLEARIKQLTKDNKLLLINNNKNFKTFFDDLLDIRQYKRLRINKIK